MSDQSIAHRRIVVVTASGHYAFRLSGRFIEGPNDLLTSAVSPEAATLAVGTIAGELDAGAVRWAASMVFYILRNCRPETPPPAVASGVLAQQARIVAMSGIDTGNPRDSWQRLMNAWLEKENAFQAWREELDKAA